MDSWIDKIDKSELILNATPLSAWELNPKFTMDDMASLIVQGAPSFYNSLSKEEKDVLIRGSIHHRSSDDKRPPKEYWDYVKEEFHIFLCSNDPKYDSLRDNLKSVGKVTGATVLSIVAAGIGDSLGFKAGAIVGLVSVCLYGTVIFGKEAYCKMYNET